MKIEPMPSRTVELLADISGRSVDELSEVARKYPFAVPPFVMRRAAEGTYSLGALRQFLPDARELEDAVGYIDDPTGENALHPESSVLQAYENRVALIVTHRCLVYCRFCFRKSFVGMPGHEISTDDLEIATDYIAHHPDVTDILLSGGDPLALSNRRLLPLLERLVELPNVKAIRIHSRALSAAPERINRELVSFLTAHTQFWYYAHMNHPDDIDHPDVIAAVRRLLSAQVPVLNQCVILAGVNDDPEVMAHLMLKCYEAKVIPYNLYLLDPVKGAAHFEVRTEKTLAICRRLSRLPGPAQPVLVYVDDKSQKHRTVVDDPAHVVSFLNGRRASRPT